MTKRPVRKRRSGFTLIELLVVVLIIGILAAIAIPQYFKVVEKGKVAEAFNYLGGLKAAQEAILARTGTYTTNTANMEINLAASLKNFAIGAPVPGTTNPPTWSVVLTRIGSPAVYGQYAIHYTGPTGAVWCNSPCSVDLLP